MNPLVGVFQYKVESFHLDCTERLSLSVLGNQLLNAAARHARSLGIGRETLRCQGMAWVFSRLQIEMERYPMEYETYTIRTWVASTSKMFSERQFALYDEQGQQIGCATSMWAILDLNARSSVPLETALPHYPSCVATDDVPSCPLGRYVRARATAAEPSYTFRPTFCDIDYNGHLNSVRYIEHFLAALPIGSLLQRPVKRFDVAYSTECRYGKELAVYVSETDNVFALEMRKPDGTTASRACITLGEKRDDTPSATLSSIIP